MAVGALSCIDLEQTVPAFMHLAKEKCDKKGRSEIFAASLRALSKHLRNCMPESCGTDRFRPCRIATRNGAQSRHDRGSLEMERLPEDASVCVRRADGGWVVRVEGAGEVLERIFEEEAEAEAFAAAHRRRLGLDVPPDVS